jgi:hypothetical protein
MSLEAEGHLRVEAFLRAEDALLLALTSGTTHCALRKTWTPARKSLHAAAHTSRAGCRLTVRRTRNKGARFCHEAVIRQH